MYETLSKFSFVGGIISVFISLAIWFMAGDDGYVHDTRQWALFVGLWAPTMFAFSTCARHMGKDRK